MDKIFKGLGSSNHCDDEREANDFYATDPTAIDDLLKVETFNHNIWECACGQGHLSKKLEEYGYNVRSTDLIDRGYGSQLDFLATIEEWDGDIITNPPYKLVTEFIERALRTVKKGNKIAMFLKLLTLEGQNRYEKIYKDNPPKIVYVYKKRKACAKGGKFGGSSAICFCWYIWEKGYKGDTIIKWI